ncbi:MULTISPECIES: hypothetical protein [unclassified Streptomyces]|uniref:hypothetical protein n=1 Tax=unclassified Streptomyces TaxID=2593676 RepID=UPI000B4FFDFB|nr:MULTISPECIES: hypothetical protein [unclassified Streptomyces]MYX04481.1 hypothetical protein [Streptomyces sp. SID8378]SNB88650.1 hypothetical protein SAMN02745831_04931 [Streptomyces sp. PgraA7]
MVRIDEPGSLRYRGQWFTADGGRLASEAPESTEPTEPTEPTVTGWNVKNPGRPAREFRLNLPPTGTGVHSLAISVPGDLMAVGAGKAVTLWDLSPTGRPERLSVVR